MSSSFRPCPLPRWERLLSHAVWCFHSAAAFFISYRVCVGPLKPWIAHWMVPSSYLSDATMDLSDVEWLFYHHTILSLLVAYAVHSGVVLMTRALPIERRTADAIQIAVDLALHVWLTSPTCMAVLTAFGAFLIVLTLWTRREAPAWMLSITFIMLAKDYVPFSFGSYTYYREFNIYLYNSIKILNICIALCRRRPSSSSSSSSSALSPFAALHYLAYLPYSMTLIVRLEEFEQQLREREVAACEGRGRCPLPRMWEAFRLLFWFVLFDALLHVIPVNAVFASPFSLIAGLNGYELSSIAYVAGQYFHVKYVVIFGVPALFARIDGMSPPAPPICISRVSRYSRMWRHFDAGLYSFLKHQVYIPILSNPTLRWLARPLAAFAAFGVVLAWHGTQTRYVCWVALSAFELMVEWIGGVIWSTLSFQRFRSSIGELFTRRLVAFGMLMTVIPGIFGVFFFLGQEGIGLTIFQNVLVDGLKQIATLQIFVKDGIPSAGLVFLHLMFLGYFFNHVCLDYEHLHARTKTKAT